jgi:hypothetical protein
LTIVINQLTNMPARDFQRTTWSANSSGLVDDPRSIATSVGDKAGNTSGVTKIDISTVAGGGQDPLLRRRREWGSSVAHA